MFAELVNVFPTVVLYSSLLILGVWIWFQWSYRDLLRAAAKVPVTRLTVPLLGHAYLTFWGLEESGRRVLQMTVGAVDRGLRTVCMWYGPFPLIHLAEANDIQIILSGANTSDKSDEYDYFVTGIESGVGPFKYNILSARGHTWKIIRKHLNPMFHRHNIQHLVPVFNKNSRELVARMREHVGKGPFNVMEYTMDVGLKTICNLVFGPEVHIDVESESFKGMLRIVELVPELFVKRVICPWLRADWVFQFLYRKEINQMITSMEKFFKTTTFKVAKEKKTRKSCFENTNENYDGSSTDENQGLLNLLDAYQPLRQKYPEFTEADMRCEMVTLYCTGTDTVGSGTASCLLALAQYQDVQERLYKEIVSVVDADCDVTLEDIAKMPYLDQVVKETLRIFTTVPYVLRKVTKDVKLRDCSIPAGSRVICNIGALHMDPKIYKNPKEFNPDRFSPENSSGKENFTFIPFSGGPRMCIAKTYAMQLIKIEIIHVLRKYRLTTRQDIHKLKNKLVITLVSTEGYNICVERRSLDKTIVGSD